MTEQEVFEDVPIEVLELKKKISLMIAEKENDLFMAWIQETGLYPSESTICYQMVDGIFKIWVEQKDKR